LFFSYVIPGLISARYTGYQFKLLLLMVDHFPGDFLVLDAMTIAGSLFIVVIKAFILCNQVLTKKKPGRDYLVTFRRPGCLFETLIGFRPTLQTLRYRLSDYAYR
jgi:hypothetical protein